MFEKIRKPGRGKAITAYVIFGAICLVFVFFGIAPTQLGFQRGGAAAIINNHQISQAEYQRRVEAMERQYSQQLQALPEAQRQLQMNQLRSQALEQLVETELLYQTATQEGFVVTDAEVRDFIVNIPAFQENGRFRRDLYSQYLQGMGYTSGQFEEQLRKDMIVDKVRNLFLSSIQPVKGEKEKSQALAESRLNLDVVSFSQKSLEQGLKVSDKEVTEFLSDEKNLAQVKQRYENTKAQYSFPEEIRARHILISNQDPSAEANLKQALERVKSEDFAKVAKEMSDDPGSAEKGGDLGYFSRGRMVEAFENAAFSQEIGVVGAPVVTSYGTHIIKVEDKKEAYVKDFEEVKQNIARSMLVQPKIEQTLGEIRSLAEASKAEELEQRLAELGLKWESTGPFALTASYIPKVGTNETLLNKVAENPQPGRLIPDLISSGGDYFLVRVKDVDLSKGTEEQGEPDQMAQFFTLRRAGEVFSSWLETAKTEARIQRNSQLLVN